MATERDNVKAGLFVLVGIVLALAIVFILSDFSRWFERNQKVQVSFQLSDGVQHLRPGAVVSLGDQPIGQVTAVGDISEPAGEGEVRVTGKRVTFIIPRKFSIYKNAVIELEVPTIGTGTWLNIASVGKGEPYKPDELIPGGVAPNILARQLVGELGISDLQRQQMQEIIANLRDLTAKTKVELPDITTRIKTLLSKAEPVVDQAQGAFSDARKSLEDINSVTAQFRQRYGAWLDRIDSVTADAKDSVATIHGLVKDPRVDQTLGNIHQITQDVREKMLGQITEALDKADAAMTNLKKSTEDLRGIIDGQRPVLERALANAQLTTDQLKLAAIEVRRSPWRLLYSPSQSELETDNLYDAARSFAQAAGTLDAAAQSLRAVVADKAQADQVKPMLDHLTALFQKYEQAEDAFWKALKDRTPGQGSPK